MGKGSPHVFKSLKQKQLKESRSVLPVRPAGGKYVLIYIFIYFFLFIPSSHSKEKNTLQLSTPHFSTGQCYKYAAGEKLYLEVTDSRPRKDFGPDKAKVTVEGDIGESFANALKQMLKQCGYSLVVAHSTDTLQLQVNLKYLDYVTNDTFWNGTMIFRGEATAEVISPNLSTVEANISTEQQEKRAFGPSIKKTKKYIQEAFNELVIRVATDGPTNDALLSD